MCSITCSIIWGASNIRGPGALNINLAPRRSFRLGEERRLELRRANFGAPVLVSRFGQITTATDPRIPQLRSHYSCISN